jgi:hypothetical protein
MGYYEFIASSGAQLYHGHGAVADRNAQALPAAGFA